MWRAAGLLICASCLSGAESPQEVLKQAVAAQQAGHLDQAIQGYQTLIEKYPDLPEIRSNLGAALAGQGRYSEAIAQYIDSPGMRIAHGDKARSFIVDHYSLERMVHRYISLYESAA